MTFEKHSCTPEELADHFEGLADAMRDGDRDAACMHWHAILHEMLDHCCEAPKLKTMHAKCGPDCDGLRSAAATMRADPARAVDWKSLIQKLLPLLLELFQ